MKASIFARKQRRNDVKNDSSINSTNELGTSAVTPRRRAAGKAGASTQTFSSVETVGAPRRAQRSAEASEPKVEATATGSALTGVDRLKAQEPVHFDPRPAVHSDPVSAPSSVDATKRDDSTQASTGAVAASGVASRKAKGESKTRIASGSSSFGASAVQAARSWWVELPAFAVVAICLALMAGIGLAFLPVVSSSLERTDEPSGAEPVSAEVAAAEVDQLPDEELINEELFIEESPAATTGVEAVERYLNALAAGDAETALALGSSTPGDDTFLNEAFLQTSMDRNPITKIKAVEGKKPNTVTATYSVGTTPAKVTLPVEETPQGWMLKDVAYPVSVGYFGAPASVNGVATSSGTAWLFPGVYTVKDPNGFVNFGDDNAIVVAGPASAKTIASKASLTAAGHKALLEATQHSVNECLDAVGVAPKGCPFAVKASSIGKADPKTLAWHLPEADWKAFKPHLNSADATAVSAKVELPFELCQKLPKNADPHKKPACHASDHVTKVSMKVATKDDALHVTFS